MLKLFIVFTISITPAIIWLYLFSKRDYDKRWNILFAFIGGMVAAKLILIYQDLWGETINMIFFKLNPVDFKENILTLLGSRPLLALFLSFVGVGVIEEYAKFWVMRIAGKNRFQSIDDVIEMAIIIALGFAFFENIVYFTQHWGQLAAGEFFVFAVMRVTVVTMVHMLCSGILGYYYGMAYFSSTMLKIQYMQDKRRHPILRFLKRVLHLKKSHLYHDEMIFIGLGLSMLIHAMYDFLLTLQIGIFVIGVMFVYFVGGYMILNYLFTKKEVDLKLGIVGTTIMPKEDFVKILNYVQEAKDKDERRRLEKPISQI